MALGKKRARDYAIDLTLDDEDEEDVEIVNIVRPRIATRSAARAPDRKHETIVLDFPEEAGDRVGKASAVDLTRGNGEVEEDKMVEQVLKVFDDCEVNHALGLVRRFKSVDQVVNHLLESDYPRSKTHVEDDAARPSSSTSRSSLQDEVSVLSPTPAPPEDSGAASSGPVMMTMEKMEQNLKLLTKAEEYKALPSADELPSDEYRALALAHLCKLYPLLAMKNVREVLKSHHFRFFATSCAIKKTIYGELLSRPSDAEPLDKAAVEKTVKANCEKAGWHLNNRPRLVLTPPELLKQDVEFTAELKFSQEFDRMEQEKMDQATRERIANEAAEKEGELIECGCCCGEYAFDVLVQCTEGHLFCSGCLRRYAQTRVFEENRTGLRCMNVNEECQGTFTDNQLIRVLDPKVYLKYQEKAAEEAVKAAELQNLVTCPACGYKAELEEGVQVFRCPDPKCGKKTCRFCQEDEHPGQKCEEVEKAKDTNARTVIEEAMTAAKVRCCPKPGCKTPFVKETGCNKIMCTGCQTLSCYICRALIPSSVGYKHFCQSPHCTHGSCNKCPLWTNAEQDDLRAVKEAGLKAKEQAKATGGEEIKDVDVDELLRAGVPATTQQARPTYQPVPPPLPPYILPPYAGGNQGWQPPAHRVPGVGQAYQPPGGWQVPQRHQPPVNVQGGVQLVNPNAPANHHQHRVQRPPYRHAPPPPQYRGAGGAQQPVARGGGVMYGGDADVIVVDNPPVAVPLPVVYHPAAMPTCVQNRHRLIPPPPPAPPQPGGFW